MCSWLKPDLRGHRNDHGLYARNTGVGSMGAFIPSTGEMFLIQPETQYLHLRPSRGDITLLLPFKVRA